MNVQWILIAEAITMDGRGALTAVGLSQTVLVVPELPAQIKRGIVAFLVGEKGEISEGDQISFSVSIKSPSDEVLTVNTGRAGIETLPWPDLPPSFNLASEFAFTVTEYGQYRITVTAKLGENPELTGELTFWVMAPQGVEE